MLLSNSDYATIVGVVFAVEYPFTITLGVCEHLFVLPIVHGDGMLVVQSDAREKLASGVKAKTNHRPLMKPPKLSQDVASLATPHANDRISSRLRGGDDVSIRMHRQGENIVTVKRKKVLHVFVPVVHHARRRRRVHNAPTRVIHGILTRIVSSISVRKVQL